MKMCFKLSEFNFVLFLHIILHKSSLIKKFERWNFASSLCELYLKNYFGAERKQRQFIFATIKVIIYRHENVSFFVIKSWKNKHSFYKLMSTTKWYYKKWHNYWIKLKITIFTLNSWNCIAIEWWLKPMNKLVYQIRGIQKIEK